MENITDDPRKSVVDPRNESHLLVQKDLRILKITDLVGQGLGYCVFLLAVVVACVYGL